VFVNQEKESTTAQIKVSGEWKKDQEKMGVSASEWCRRMIRLGRRQYGLPYDPNEMPDVNGVKTERDIKTDTDHFRGYLLANLSTDRYLTVDELLEITEEEIEEIGEELENAGIAEYSYRRGFKLADDWQERDTDV